ncbi:hypothetical protein CHINAEXTREME_17240 [Halobiforma lacisalsi AJ5]|uniref:Uncharacterized protein n=1 Tax=Natronobacterium lacisalsi AJ5 TaxID=358396 RepID=M0LP67_NATLA|nr:hypothetical protein [Halobiforma lacisalsi]APW99407.1 hypothetical protein CHINAEXTREME_17240 [Halobiforma lacisalsi AJ5]EMA35291.1 hypothetical protein C445_05543 [Halobiforma lacisalsi AJ5]
MSRIRLGTKVAEQFGTSVQKGIRFVDDAGPRAARRVLDTSSDAARGTARWLQSPGGKATAFAGTIGAGGYAWREQDVREAEALAERSENYNEVLQEIIESDLPPEMKKEMAEEATEAEAGGNSGSVNDGDGPLEAIGLGNLSEDPVMLLVTIVVLVVILQQVLDEGQGMVPNSVRPSGGGQA